jgi:hypothetical protein
MPKSHRPYPPELRQRIVELVRKGRSPEELAPGVKQAARCSIAPPIREHTHRHTRPHPKLHVLDEPPALVCRLL